LSSKLVKKVATCLNEALAGPKISKFALLTDIFWLAEALIVGPLFSHTCRTCLNLSLKCIYHRVVRIVLIGLSLFISTSLAIAISWL